MKNIILTIDGPAGSGKEKISKYISKKYKFFHLDSGIIYRKISFLILKNNINYNNPKILKEFLIKIKNISSRSHYNLRNENIGMIASKIAVLPSIRRFINKNQKIIVSSKLKKFRGCVIDGRDIGSKVFKDAKIKLYIECNPEIRAKRRHKQLIAVGEKSIYSRILKEINLRDKTDKNRKFSPLVIPKGAIVIDNSKSFKITSKLIKQTLVNIK